MDDDVGLRSTSRVAELTTQNLGPFKLGPTRPRLNSGFIALVQLNSVARYMRLRRSYRILSQP